jgi:hypothetical protein
MTTPSEPKPLSPFAIAVEGGAAVTVTLGGTVHTFRLVTMRDLASIRSSMPDSERRGAIFSDVWVYARSPAGILLTLGITHEEGKLSPPEVQKLANAMAGEASQAKAELKGKMFYPLGFADLQLIRARMPVDEQPGATFEEVLNFATSPDGMMLALSLSGVREDPLFNEEAVEALGNLRQLHDLACAVVRHTRDAIDPAVNLVYEILALSLGEAADKENDEQGKDKAQPVSPTGPQEPPSSAATDASATPSA